MFAPEFKRSLKSAMCSSSWIANDNTPQTSLGVDANRLILLDRAEVGAAAQEEIPF